MAEPEPNSPEISAYPYWLTFETESHHRLGSYFTRAAPPDIGEKVNLDYLFHHEQAPEIINPGMLYIVIDIIHCPEKFFGPAYWDTSCSDLDFVKIVLRLA